MGLDLPILVSVIKAIELGNEIAWVRLKLLISGFRFAAGKFLLRLVSWLE